MTKQMYSSADTSINSTKMPRIYSLVAVNSDQTVIDYGCGKYFDSYDLPENFTGYDKFNYPNLSALGKHYDIAFCSNVLNVIAEPEIRSGILADLADLADTVYITIYEGDGSGISRTTKADCYQLNWKHGAYTDEIRKHFSSVKWSKGCFICHN